MPHLPPVTPNLSHRQTGDVELHQSVDYVVISLQCPRGDHRLLRCPRRQFRNAAAAIPSAMADIGAPVLNRSPDDKMLAPMKYFQLISTSSPRIRSPSWRRGPAPAR